jgi:hypothetical protein
MHTPTLNGQPGHTDVGPGWLQLAVCNARPSLGVSNVFTVVQQIALTAIVDQADNSTEATPAPDPRSPDCWKGSGLNGQDTGTTQRAVSAPTARAYGGARL